MYVYEIKRLDAGFGLFLPCNGQLGYGTPVPTNISSVTNSLCYIQIQEQSCFHWRVRNGPLCLTSQ